MKNWEPSYRRQMALKEQIRDNTNLLKFQKRAVGSSEIGSQFYCEEKVELAYIYGTMETQEMLFGTEGHEKAVEDFVKVDLEDLWRHISEKGWRWIAETPFIMRCSNIFIVGRPDQILFINSRPQLLFEFKFSTYTTTFPGQHVQAESYGLLLKESGFDTSSLFYAIVVLPHEIKDSNFLKELPKKIAEEFFRKELFTQSSSKLYYDKINVFIQEFDQKQAEKDLGYALEYWLGLREAEGTDNPNKCRSCELLAHCPKKPI